jgi:hypothetical protein
LHLFITHFTSHFPFSSSLRPFPLSSFPLSSASLTFFPFSYFSPQMTSAEIGIFHI